MESGSLDELHRVACLVVPLLQSVCDGVDKLGPDFREALSDVVERCRLATDSLRDAFDLDAPRAGRGRGAVAADRLETALRRRLRYHRKRRHESADALAELRGDRVSGFLSTVWFVRAGLGDPTIPAVRASTFLKSFFATSPKGGGGMP